SAEVGMGVGLMRMDADRRPDIRIALGNGNNFSPFLLAGRYVEKAGNPPAARALQHLVLALGQPGIVEVAVAIDQSHAASSPSPSGSSSLGKTGVGCSIGLPSMPEP